MAAKKGLRLNWLDIVVLSLIAAAVIFIAYRVNVVLKYEWGWHSIPGYIIRYDEDEERWVANLLLQGFFTTIRLSIWASVLAAIIGVVLGLCRTSHNMFLRMVGRAYVELIRNIPPLVFLFIFYFFISSQIMPLFNLDGLMRDASPTTVSVVSFLFGSPKLLDNFVGGMIALAMFEAAYVAEIVRAGVQSIDKGQWEAANAVGISRLDVLRFVILPQAIKRVVPPLANQFISLIKDSSIISLISIQELTFMAQDVVIATHRLFEVWIVTALFYFVICFGFSLAFGRLEKRMQVDSERV